ncbi:heme-binding protein [Mycobacterium sp. C3-094]|uniref:heme-binding protein n=1 Tax=Mycobacterium sp. PSTR-4-N TaxID=2917745 RepID=UPI0035B09D20
MAISFSMARRMIAGALGAGAVLVCAASPAQAQPNCTAADLAGIMAGVTASTSAYLFTHPQVNDFFTSLKDVPKDQRQSALADYASANPQVQAELQGIRQPAVDFRNRCG